MAGAEMLFYLQMEFDKFIVLGVGGAKLAGLYAIIMRLVDLTAIPIRTFSMMLVQKMMRLPQMLSSIRLRSSIEFGIFTVSTAALCALASILYFFPNALGGNVAGSVGMLALALFIPGFRNLVEYQAELLFARGQTLIRVINLAALAAAKGLALFLVLSLSASAESLIWSLNLVFAGLYLISTVLTHTALRRETRPV